MKIIVRLTSLLALLMATSCAHSFASEVDDLTDMLNTFPGRAPSYRGSLMLHSGLTTSSIRHRRASALARRTSWRASRVPRHRTSRSGHGLFGRPTLIFVCTAIRQLSRSSLSVRRLQPTAVLQHHGVLLQYRHVSCAVTAHGKLSPGRQPKSHRHKKRRGPKTSPFCSASFRY